VTTNVTAHCSVLEGNIHTQMGGSGRAGTLNGKHYVIICNHLSISINYIA